MSPSKSLKILRLFCTKIFDPFVHIWKRYFPLVGSSSNYQAYIGHGHNEVLDDGNYGVNNVDIAHCSARSS